MTEQTLKLLTYNVHRGRSPLRRRDICEQIAGILDFSSADVVCLQEVWQHDGFERHQLEEHLCDERWRHRVFAKTVDFRRGAQGNAVVSQLPVEAWTYLDISIPKREPRGILHTKLALADGRTATIFCVHLGLHAHERRQQVTLLQKFIHEQIDEAAPLIIAGDFNDWKRDVGPVLRGALGAREVMLDKLGRYGRTYPSFWPVLALDRIYYRNCILRDARIVRERRCLALSDHLPVEAVFDL